MIDFFEAMAINGRWVRLRLASDPFDVFPPPEFDAYVSGVFLPAPEGGRTSWITTTTNPEALNALSEGSEVFLQDIDRVVRVYRSKPRTGHLRAV